MSTSGLSDADGDWVNGIFLLAASALVGVVAFFVVGGGPGILSLGIAVGGFVGAFVALSYLLYGR
jgi:hypothetical protein